MSKVTISTTEYEALLELALSALDMTKECRVTGSDVTFCREQSEIWNQARQSRGEKPFQFS